MNFIYKLLNIKIINLYLTKLSEKIYKYLRKSSKENKLDLFRQIIESIHKTSYYKNKSKPLMWDTFTLIIICVLNKKLSSKLVL